MKQAYSLPGIVGLETLPEDKSINYNDVVRELTYKALRVKNLSGQDYVDRLERELKVISDKNVSVYFIILKDIIDFCKKNNILYGYGRGSAAGSLVSYLLGIVSVDPLKYNLLFERFLDPQRLDMPDIDLDVQDSRREEIITYLRNKYGEDHVAGITNFSYFGDKAAFTSAAKVFCLPFNETKEISKNIETLEDLAKVDNGNFVKQNKNLVKLALALRGRFSGYGRHAGGQVITKMPIDDIAPVETRSVNTGSKVRKPVVALDKNQSEELGLVKIDLLGLTTLSVVAETLELIKKNYGKVLDLDHIPDNDANVYEMIAQGHTLGIFQLESKASTDLAKNMKISNFTELYTSNALVRSGAWNAFGPDYLATKDGKKKPKYPTEQSKDFLEDTLGFCVMQEASMLLCQHVANLSVVESNQIRRLTSKKKSKEELKPYRDKFISGCISNNVSEAEAEKLWQNIETTAEYQFNKCLSFDTEVDIKIDNEQRRVNLEYLYNLSKTRNDIYILGPEKVIKTNVHGQKWYRVKDVHDNGQQPCMRIWVDSETYIDSTFMHQHRLSKRWKQAYRIHQNDPIWMIDGKHDVAGRRYVGISQTYDVELDEEPHAFYANGFLTHNSHAVAYSKLSIATAWLKYYYPAEFLTALFNNTASDDPMLPQYFIEAARLGINVREPDVNKSEVNYTTKNNVIYMGLSNIKGLSDKSAERLIMMRPFSSYADLCDKIMAKGSGLTSTTLKGINAVGAARFKDNKVDEEEVRANRYEYLGVVSFDNRAITDEMRSRMFNLEEYNDKSIGVADVVAQSIVQKNGWIRIDFIGSTGSVSFFVDDNHGFKKGGMYLILFSGRKILMSYDLSEKATSPIIKYLSGDMSDGTYLVAANKFKTKTGKFMASAVLSHKERLFSALIFQDDLHKARMIPFGTRVKIGVTKGRDGTIIIKEIIKDE